MKRFELAPLPYAYNALEPIISAETFQYHHDKHHQAYVDKLNELIVGTEFADASLEEIVRRSSGPIFNNAGQHWNHDFYWKSMAPQSAAKGPQGKLLQAIEKTYGKFDSFKAEFEKMGTTLFGSGWVWLVSNSSGELKIVQTQNAENPMRQQLTPLFTCDVWEHAYYIDYRNARAKYLSKFWEVLNWEFAGKNFEKIK
jgi:Fe-Mn family superoxide dismutase